jgi:hypothetical protein
LRIALRRIIGACCCGRRRTGSWESSCIGRPIIFNGLIEPQTVAEEQAGRLRVTKGRPFGDAGWQARTTNRLGLQSAYRLAGRHRKSKPERKPRKLSPAKAHPSSVPLFWSSRISGRPSRFSGSEKRTQLDLLTAEGRRPRLPSFRDPPEFKSSQRRIRAVSSFLALYISAATPCEEPACSNQPCLLQCRQRCQQLRRPFALARPELLAQLPGGRRLGPGGEGGADGLSSLGEGFGPGGVFLPSWLCRRPACLRCRGCPGRRTGQSGFGIRGGASGSGRAFLLRLARRSERPADGGFLPQAVSPKRGSCSNLQWVLPIWPKETLAIKVGQVAR